MFDRIAPRYDLLNRLLSAGTDVRWRRRAVDLLDLRAPVARARPVHGHRRPADRGAAARPAPLGPGRRPVPRRCWRGERRSSAGAGTRAGRRLAGGDGERLPLRDGALRRGARGLRDPQRGRPRSRPCARCVRVLRPGGRFVVLEFSMPKGVLGSAYRLYFRSVLPRLGGPRERRRLGLLLPPGLGRAASRRPEAFAALMEEAGLREVRWQPADRRDRLPAPGREAAMRRLGPTLQRAAEWLRPRRDDVLGDWVRAVADVRGVAEAGGARGVRAGARRPARPARGRATWRRSSPRRPAAAGARRPAGREPAGRGPRHPRPRPLPRPRPGRGRARTASRSRRPWWPSTSSATGASRRSSPRRRTSRRAGWSRPRSRRRGRRSGRARCGGRTRRCAGPRRRASHRAEQIGLLSSVAHRIAPIREPERADAAGGRPDPGAHEPHLRRGGGARRRRASSWAAGRAARGSGARARAGPQGPPGRGHRPGPAPAGPAGRGRRRRTTPTTTPTCRAPAPRWSIPLLEGSEALGALDFQSERPFAFALDDVAAGETLAEFLVIALRNARLYQEARRRPSAE